MRQRLSNNLNCGNCGSEPEMKTGRIEQACARYGLGRNTMRTVAKKAEAEIKVGKCYLINFSKVDAYMDSLTD